LRTDEPQYEVALPEAPNHLDEIAKEEWARVAEPLYRQGILTEVDVAVLAVYCQTWARWVHAENALAASGLLVKQRNGNLAQSPLLRISNRAMADMSRAAAEFGMTPSSRSRVSASPMGSSTNPFDDLG
jgi:P27 family predicted phage terminase small subunit